MLKEVKILNGQNIADIALQETGNFEGLFDLAVTNGISLTQEVAAGSSLSVNTENINEAAYRQVKKENVIPATDFGFVLYEGSEPILEGIGYWAIGIDFIVS